MENLKKRLIRQPMQKLKTKCKMFVIGVSALLSVTVANVHATTDVSPDSNRRTDSNVALVSAWGLLDNARSYRNWWGERKKDLKKSYSQLVEGYTEDRTVCGDKAARECLLDAAKSFRDIVISDQDDSVIEEAKWGLQETHNEYMAGQSLIANDLLLNGLRVRFSNVGDPDDPSQIKLLTNSEAEFQKGIDNTIYDLRTQPDLMRVKGPDPTFPFKVLNSLPYGGGDNPERVESELYRFTHLVERRAIAANSKGKRMFFFGNVKDTDSFPYGNFPGQEDLDLNGDGIINEAGRAEAAQQFKRSAHSTYLNSAVLSAIQTESEFYNNDGYTLKRQVTDAEQMFNDIKQGFNPLQLQGDFVPYQPVENFINLANSRIRDAIDLEQQALAGNRQYDVDETTLADTLQSNRERYVDQIVSLTGLDPNAFELLKAPEHGKISPRETLINAAKENAKLGYGQMGIQFINIESSKIAINTAILQLSLIPQRMQIEKLRLQRMKQSNDEYSQVEGRLNAAYELANCCEVSMQGPKINPNAPIAAANVLARTALTAGRTNDAGKIQSQAVISNMLLDAVLQATSIVAAINDRKRELARYDELVADLGRLIDNYQQSNENMADAYFKNPAYRFRKDQIIEAAEDSFETAMVESYYAVRALEYFWSEKYNNPVLRQGGLLPESLSVKFDPFIRAESVFSSAFAGGISPSLSDFMGALQAWDVKMRQFRTPNWDHSNVNISLRKDVLGFNSGDNELDKVLFEQFVREHRVKGLNPDNDDLILEFSLGIADENIFPNHPNIKIENLMANLVSGSRSIRGGTGAAPVKVDLVQMDKAIVRSFFADYPKDDDILFYDLEEGRTIDKSPFASTVDATIDNYSYPQASANVQLAGHSPAVTRWALRIKMNRKANKELILENLDDIELNIAYTFGKPRQIAF